MTWELHPSNRGYVLVGTEMESTYGTEPTMDLNDVLYVDSFEAIYSRTVEPRTGHAPYRAGFPPVVTGAELTWTATGEVAVRAISDPPVAADAPTFDPILRLCGFQRVLGGAGQNSISYFLRTYGFESSTIYGLSTNNAGDDENRTRIRGARGSLKLSFQAGKKVTWDAAGGGIPQATIANTSASTGAGPAAVVYPKLPVVVAQGARVKLIRLDTDALYGGGTLAVPTYSALVLSCEIDCNMNIQHQAGLSGIAGVARVMPVPREPVKISLVIEEVDESEWSPFVLRDGEVPLEINMRFPCASNTARTMQVVCYGHIVNVTRGNEGEHRTWALDIETAWPEDATDSDPAVGTTPAQLIVTGTNQGLDENPGGGTPVPSVLAIQFDAAS